MPEAAGTAGYRFEPLARRGLLLGLGAGQLAVVVACVLVALWLVKALPGLGGFAAASASLAGAGALCRPVAGRPPLGWLGVAASFALRRRAETMAPPGSAPIPQPLRLPAGTFAPGTHLTELPAAAGQGPIGVVLDERSGTAAALLRARGSSFCLLDGTDQARKLAAWAAVLESVSSHRSSLARLQWCQRAVPADSDPLLSHLRRAGDPTSPGYRGHVSLLEAAGQKSWRHETLLVVVVRVSRRRGCLSKQGAEALRNEVRALRAQMHNVGIACDGLLDARGAAAALGSFLVPGLDRHPGAHPLPLAVRENWAEVRVDGHFHRTYWVAEWPRSRVGPDFLSPLLVGSGRRSFSVVMAPIPPERAVRDAESSRTAQVADAQLRAQGGFLETAQQRRQAEAIQGREAELADGRGAFELAGYVTVSAADLCGLEQACSELERAAGAAKLCLRPLFGQQREALVWALPFGRGL
jgi:hypothetical protein